MIPSLQRNILFLPLFALFLMALATSVPAFILDLDLDGDIDLSNDAGIYVTVLAHFFGQDPQQAQQWYSLCPDKDDLTVLLYLAKSTGRTPAYFLVLRDQNLSWWEISQGMNVNPNDWFTPTRNNPPPPFAEPYRNWKASSEEGETFDLSDADCRNLVAARFLTEYFEVTIARAIEMRMTGRKMEKICADEVRRQQDHEKSVARNSYVKSAS